LTINQILLKYWGFSKFRPLQEEIINSILDGKDTLALLPTGGGKSICYQIPALAKEGICIVVSPLIALMKDQVENLKKRNIKAIAIYSGMHQSEIDISLDNAVYGDYKLLYVSPERLETEMFLERFKKMKVNLIAVDEAHCISQWGYDFRPPYLNIAKIRDIKPNVPVMALTATATKEVVDDIQEKLRFKTVNVFSKSFERKNLVYYVIKEENKLKRLLKLITNINGCGIVYVRNRRKTKEIAVFLEKNKISADYYHAGLDPQTRDKKQNSWMSGYKKVIVSTNAFGMGIDKPDVRFVIHLDIPDSIEAYFQEAGRAGRDEQKAYAVLLYENSDIIDLEKNLNNTFPPIEEIKKIYGLLCNYFQIPVGGGKESSFEFNISQFSDNYNLSPLVVYSSLKLLEKEGFLLLSDGFMSYSKIHFKVGKDDLYRFQVEKEAYDSFIKTILRLYGGIFNDFIRIDEQTIANKTNLKKEDVVKFLNKLESFNILSYIPSSNSPKITFINPRLNDNDVLLSDENYKIRKVAYVKRLDAVKEYVVSQSKCRSQHLLEYFGDMSAKRCGNCDVCLERNKLELSEYEFDIVLKQIKPLLQNGNCSIEDLAKELPGVDDDNIIKVVQYLLDNDKVSIDERKLLKWRS
jgi:ATP-dependent DNA helicase RecQ